MKIILLDQNPEICKAWETQFENMDNIEVCEGEFSAFMKCAPEDLDGIVSPANSFGLMDGGYDAVLTDYFGEQVMQAVQKTIIERYKGIQPVGTAMSVPIRNDLILIHVPTMYFPERIQDEKVIFQCMLSTLLEGERINREKIVIPAFGGGVGGVSVDVIAGLMKAAYMYYLNPINDINWAVAHGLHEMIYDCIC